MDHLGATVKGQLDCSACLPALSLAIYWYFLAFTKVFL
jgi:hypothetical protein